MADFNSLLNTLENYYSTAFAKGQKALEYEKEMAKRDIINKAASAGMTGSGSFYSGLARKVENEYGNLLNQLTSNVALQQAVQSGNLLNEYLNRQHRFQLMEKEYELTKKLSDETLPQNLLLTLLGMPSRAISSYIGSSLTSNSLK